jgi:hypothetical protein
MTKFGWAYVDCSDTTPGSGSEGPNGSLQFVTESGGGTTGSYNLIYYTASAHSYDPNTMVLSGNLIVTGAISASVFTVKDIIHIDATGSTYFGNSDDDEHIRTGSFVVTKAGAGDGSGYTLSASHQFGRTFVRGFAGRYRKVTATSYYIGTEEFIIGASASANQTLYLPTASAVKAGALLIIKDQYRHRSSTSIYISASQHGHQTIDDLVFYHLTGSMSAINLYSDGSNWFVY